MVILQHDGSVHSNLAFELRLRQDGSKRDAERTKVVVVSTLDSLVGTDLDNFSLDIE